MLANVKWDGCRLFCHNVVLWKIQKRILECLLQYTGSSCGIKVSKNRIIRYYCSPTLQYQSITEREEGTGKPNITFIKEHKDIPRSTCHILFSCGCHSLTQGYFLKVILPSSRVMAMDENFAQFVELYQYGIQIKSDTPCQKEHCKISCNYYKLSCREGN